MTMLSTNSCSFHFQLLHLEVFTSTVKHYWTEMACSRVLFTPEVIYSIPEMGKDMKPRCHLSSTIILKPLNALLCYGSLRFRHVLRYIRKLSSPLGAELHSKCEENNMPGDKSKMERASEGKSRLTHWCCWDLGYVWQQYCRKQSWDLA